MMGLGKGLIDRVGEHRVGADFDEGAVLFRRGGDGLTEPHRLTQIRRPVVGRRTPAPTHRNAVVENTGITGVRGAKSANAVRNSGSTGSISG